jgi:hypothetical protein
MDIAKALVADSIALYCTYAPQCSIEDAYNLVWLMNRALLKHYENSPLRDVKVPNLISDTGIFTIADGCVTVIPERIKEARESVKPYNQAAGELQQVIQGFEDTMGLNILVGFDKMRLAAMQTFEYRSDITMRTAYSRIQQLPKIYRGI